MGAPQNTGPSFIPAPTAQFGGAVGSAALFVVNGNLYAFLQTIGSGGGNINGTGIYKSTDGGTTWNQMDASHAPKSAVGSAFYDSTGNQLICGLCTTTSPVTLQSTFLKNFSFASDTWGASYATGGPNSSAAVWFTFKRTDGTILIFINLSTSNPGGQSNLQAAYWNGSAWSAQIDIGNGLVALQANGRTTGADTAAVMDSNGNISIAFDNNLRTIFCFQQLKSDNTLGTFIQFSETFQSSLPPFGFMQIIGTKILLPAITDASAHNTLFTFTPLVGPSYTSAVIAALTPPVHGVNYPGALTSDGTNLYWMVTWQDTPSFNNIFQIAKSSDNGATWAFLSDNGTSPYFYSFTASPLAPNTDPSFGISAVVLAFGAFKGNSVLFGATNVNNSSTTTQNAYFLNSEILGSAPAVLTKFEISLFGTKRWAKQPEPDCKDLPEPKHVKFAW